MPGTWPIRMLRGGATLNRSARLVLPAFALAVVVACARPIDRPLEGARPVGAEKGGGAVVGASLAQTTAEPASVPPLAVALTNPSPSPAAAGHNPILSGLAPAPESRVAPGPVNIGARIAASVELAEVTLLLNGAIVQPRINSQDPKTWLIAYTGQFDQGRQEVRLTAKDRDGRAGGYRWQFDVGGASPNLAATAAPPRLATPTPRPAPAPSPQPAQPRRP